MKASENFEVSIVMPCLNEAETVGTCVQKAQHWLRESGVTGEIIVADNGSIDGSQAIAGNLGATLISVEAKGYGNALLGGFSAAQGKFIIMGDADDSYDFSKLSPFLEKLREGYDLVMGNRFQGGIQPHAMPLLHRYLGNPVLTRIGQILFHSPCGDFHCGLRAIRREAIAKLDLRTTGMEFASEMVVKATLLKLKVTEVPTTLTPAGRSRSPQLRSWRDGWRHLRFLLLYSPRWLFLYPGCCLMLLGLGIGIWLLPGPIVVGHVKFDRQTLLYAAAAIIIGFQAVIFAVFTKIFAISEGLLPRDPRFDKVFRYLNLEVGLIAGFILTVAGLAGSIYAVSAWGERHFGGQDTAKTLRIIIPSVTSLILGCQVILSSFFLSVLGLRRR